jgi:hypothetical protein
MSRTAVCAVSMKLLKRGQRNGGQPIIDFEAKKKSCPGRH